MESVFTDHTLAHPLNCRGGVVARLSAYSSVAPGYWTRAWRMRDAYHGIRILILSFKGDTHTHTQMKFMVLLSMTKGVQVHPLFFRFWQSLLLDDLQYHPCSLRISSRLPLPLSGASRPCSSKWIRHLRAHLMHLQHINNHQHISGPTSTKLPNNLQPQRPTTHSRTVCREGMSCASDCAAEPVLVPGSLFWRRPCGDAHHTAPNHGHLGMGIVR